MKNVFSTLVGASVMATSLAIGIAPNASAFSISGGNVTGISAADIGESFTVLFDGNVNTTDVPGLSAEAIFTVTNFTSSSAVFDIALTNTSSDGIGSRVSGLGFNTDPILASASSSGVFNIAVLEGAFPNQFGSVDVCFKDGGGPNNCQGGGSGGVTTGNTGNFTVTLGFAPNSVPPLSLSNFGVRYQSITGTNLGTSGTGTGAAVPEPLTILGVGTALGFGTAFKRKLGQNKQNSEKA